MIVRKVDSFTTMYEIPMKRAVMVLRVISGEPQYPSIKLQTIIAHVPAERDEEIYSACQYVEGYCSLLSAELPLAMMIDSSKEDEVAKLLEGYYRSWVEGDDDSDLD